jgi:hypothetical protein
MLRKTTPTKNKYKDLFPSIGTQLTTAGTSTLAPHQPTPEILLSFEPPVAPLPAPAVPPGFLPQAATTAAPCATPPAAPRAAPTVPPAVTDSPPPRTWPGSPVAYVRREVGAGAAGTRGAPRAALNREVGAGAVGHMAPPELPCARRRVLEPR